MTTDEPLPVGWTTGSAKTKHDDLMGWSYERRTSEHKDGTASAAIIEVEEPTEFEGWG